MNGFDDATRAHRLADMVEKARGEVAAARAG
jgi:hypothetical protein